MSLPDLPLVGKPHATIVHLDTSLQVIEDTVSLLSTNDHHALGICCRSCILTASMLGHQNATHDEDESRRGSTINAEGICKLCCFL